MSMSIKSSSAHGSTGSMTLSSTDTKAKAKTVSAPTTAAFAKAPRHSLDLAGVHASLQLVSRELSTEQLKRDGSSESQTTGTAPALTEYPPSATSTRTALPRPDRTISWADVNDSDSEEDAHSDEFDRPGQTLIPSFCGEVSQPGQEAGEGSGPSANESPSPLEPSVAAAAHSDSSDEPVQTHFGFNLLSLGAVPEDAEVDSSSAVEDATDPNNRVSVLISGGADDWAKGQPVSAPPRQHGYAGVLTMLHRSVHAENGDLPASSLAVTSARIEAVLPVGQDERVKQMVRRAMHGFKAQQEPSVPREGMGGTYFLVDDSGDKVGIFKPCDEEPLAPNNPKGWAGRAMGAPGMKPSVRVGEAALREVAAYLLDHGGFAGVPPAALVLCRHPVLNYKVKMPKIESLMDLSAIPRGLSDAGVAAAGGAGSGPGLQRALSRCALSDPAPAAAAARAEEEWSSHLAGPALPGGYKLGSFQAFAASIGDANDIAPSHFSAENVHRIGILDIRLLNCDRHAGNLLVAERGTAGAAPAAPAAPESVTASLPADALQRLVPIDHGFALPEALEEPYFEWQYWPQTNVPFSAEVREYVAGLDAQADIAMLRQQIPALRLECLRCLEVTTLVLKECTAAGLTLFEVANVFSRPNEQVPSDFEVMCIDARADALDSAPPTLFAATASMSEDASPVNPLAGSASMAGLGPATGDGPAVSPRSSLGMSGLLPTPEECAPSDASISSPREIAKASFSGSSGRLSSDASPTSPCLAAAGSSAPRPIVSSWLRTAGVLPSTAGGASAMMSPPAMFPALMSAAGGVATPTAQSDVLPAVFIGEGGCADVPPPPGSMLNMRCGRAGGLHSRRRRRRSAWASKRGLHGADPALVQGVHPQKAKYVFTGVSDTQWLVFVERMGEYVADELCKGTWRVGRQSCPMAGSCPEPAKTHRF